MAKPILTAEYSHERPDLSDLTAEDIAPLERMFDEETPDIWRDLAQSFYLTLRTVLSGVDNQQLATLSMALTKGIASDLGGQQPYINAGSQLMASARARRVIELCSKGLSYAEVARQCGNITENRVRQIEREWVRQQRAARQGVLDLA